MSDNSVPPLASEGSAVTRFKSFRSSVPTKDSVFKEVMDNEECRHPIVLALVSKDCGNRIRYQKGELKNRPNELEKLVSATREDRILGCDHQRNPTGKDAQKSKLLTQTDVSVRYPNDLINIEMHPFLENDFKTLQYFRALVASLLIHEDRRLAGEFLHPETPCSGRLTESEALDASTVTHVEHIVLLTKKIADDDLLQESVDGKEYIAEFRTKGIECGTQPSSIELVYRVFTLSRAPRDCFESQDMTDFWASNLFADQESCRGRLPAAKLWFNVPPSFRLVPGAAAFMRVLGFTELGVNDEISPRNMALMLTEVETGRDELSARVRIELERLQESRAQLRTSKASYETQARATAAEGDHKKSWCRELETHLAEANRGAEWKLGAEKRKLEILEATCKTFSSLVDRLSQKGVPDDI